MKAAAALLALVLAAASRGEAQGRIETGFLDRTVEMSGQTYRYQIYVPAEYTPGQAWPIILDLHGNGAQGTDGMFQTTGRSATPIRAERARYPVLVVFPQAQPDTRWLDVTMQDMAIAELDQTIREYKIDPARVYLTGFSMGATGAYAFVARWPDRFAALVTVAGSVERRANTEGGNATTNGGAAAEPGSSRDQFNALAQKIKDLPIWIFHGASDENVPVEQSRRLTAALKGLGVQVRYTEYPNTSHQGAWGRAFADPQMTAWLLAQRRREKSE